MEMGEIICAAWEEVRKKLTDAELKKRLLRRKGKEFRKTPAGLVFGD